MKKSKRYIKKLTKTPLINKRVMNYIINNSNICKHAIRELKLAGYDDDKGGPNDWMYQQVIEAVAVFDSHGNSGCSAPFEINLVKNLCNWNVISPLRFTNDEWQQISSDGTCQNIRKGDVLKSQMAILVIMGLLLKNLLKDIVLLLKNGLKIKLLFIGVEVYLNMKIIF